MCHMGGFLVQNSLNERHFFHRFTLINMVGLCSPTFNLKVGIKQVLLIRKRVGC